MVRESEMSDHPKAAHYGLEPCDIPNCAWCEKRPHPVVVPEEGKMGEFHRSGQVYETTEDDNPSRFDPYEALDTVLRLTECIETTERYEVDQIGCLGELDDIRVNLNALRAYITGMER